MRIRSLISDLQDEISQCEIKGENEEIIKVAQDTLEKILECVQEIESANNDIQSSQEVIKKVVY